MAKFATSGKFEYRWCTVHLVVDGSLPAFSFEYGYPDPTYLQRVEDELKQFGIVRSMVNEKDLPP